MAFLDFIYKPIVDKLVDDIAQKTRALTIADLKSIQNNDPKISGSVNWLADYRNPVGYGNSKTPEDLNLITPQVLEEVCNEQTVSSAKEAIHNLFIKKGWGFLGGRNSSQALKKILEESGFDDWIDQRFEALWGTGGGNAITRIVNQNGKTKLILEPFYAEGNKRVQTINDYNNRKVLEYVVFNNSGQAIAKYSADQVLHSRFYRGGDFRFSSNPAIKAAKYYTAKRLIMASIQEGFKRITNSNRFAAPTDKFMEIINQDPELLGNFRNKWDNFARAFEGNGIYINDFPMNFVDMHRTPKEMGAKELLSYIDQIIGGCYLVSASITGKTEGVNYSNAEANRDNLSEINVEPAKRRLEQEVIWVLKVLVPNYNPDKNPFYFGREPTAEEIEIKQMKFDEDDKHIKQAVFLAQAGVQVKFKDGFFEDKPYQIPDKPLENLLKDKQDLMTKNEDNVDKELLNNNNDPKYPDNSKTENAERNIRAIKDYGCVMAMYENSQFAVITEQIENDDLYVDPEEPLQNGLVKNFHTTLLYGLHPEVTLEQVKEVVNKKSHEDFEETLLQDTIGIKKKAKNFKIFSNPNKPYDVLVLEMAKQEDLIRINRELKTLPYTTEYDTYVPHTTIAYLKKGLNKYDDLTIPENLDFTVKDIVYSQASQGLEYTSLLEKKQRSKISLEEFLQSDVITRSKEKINNANAKLNG